MAVYKRKGTSIYQIEIKHNGHRIRKSSGTKSKRKAQELERRWMEELHDQVVMGRPAEMSLGEAAERYYNTIILPKSNPRVASREKYMLDKMVRVLGKDLPINFLKSPVITKFRDDLITEGKAPATVNRYLASLKAILNRAHKDWGTLDTVPPFRLLSLDNARYRWITEEEEQRLLDAAPDHIRNLIIFLVDTGARKSEALNLTWADVDLDRKPRPAVNFMQTKSGKPRSVPLTHRVTEMLRGLLLKRPESLEHVFLYHPFFGGELAPYKQPHGSWKTVCKRAGVTDIVMHDLRHTFASRLVSKSVSLLAVSTLLGHASIKMTQRYAHLAPGAFDNAIDVLES
ncbi:tyrosine-type recombinase/integrase [Terasakiella pusilla]|uniref:tyrosine-type recombinase/integrase n=1 Tax=Terasakiella pusilla TaxID=64973 RepID=UPI003AA7C247